MDPRKQDKMKHPRVGVHIYFSQSWITLLKITTIADQFSVPNTVVLGLVHKRIQTCEDRMVSYPLPRLWNKVWVSCIFITTLQHKSTPKKRPKAGDVPSWLFLVLLFCNWTTQTNHILETWGCPQGEIWQKFRCDGAQRWCFTGLWSLTAIAGWGRTAIEHKDHVSFLIREKPSRKWCLTRPLPPRKTWRVR